MKERYHECHIPIFSYEFLIYTISSSSQFSQKKTPLVLLHGWNGGVGYWIKNFDDLARNRPVYILDVPGFGRSSGPSFDSANKTDVDATFVKFIDQWMATMGLDEIILNGHSFGAYIGARFR